MANNLIRDPAVKALAVSYLETDVVRRSLGSSPARAAEALEGLSQEHGVHFGALAFGNCRGERELAAMRITLERLSAGVHASGLRPFRPIVQGRSLWPMPTAPRRSWARP